MVERVFECVGVVDNVDEIVELSVLDRVGVDDKVDDIVDDSVLE